MVTVIPTGILALDIALGMGGLPHGQIVEIFGAESTGKTTLCLHIVTEAQKQGRVAVIVDADHALDAAYAAHCGVDVDRLLFARPDDADQALEITEKLVHSGAVGLIVVDSVAALADRAKIEGGSVKNGEGSLARLLSRHLRKLMGIIQETGATVIFTNQLRQRVGVMFGVPETTPGGMALKLHAAVRMELALIESIRLSDVGKRRTSSSLESKPSDFGRRWSSSRLEAKSPDFAGPETVGSRIRVRVVKNKLARPFRTAEFNIMYNGDISQSSNLLDLAVESLLINKHGTSYFYGEQYLGRGRDDVVECLRTDQGLANEIERVLRQRYLPSSPMPVDGG
jgi:recombination protein RecA